MARMRAKDLDTITNHAGRSIGTASRRLVRFGSPLVLVLAAASAMAGVVGTGTPASCTQSALATQIAAGGTVTFNCGGVATIFTNLSIASSNPATVVDGGGLITLDGSHVNAPIMWINGSAAVLPDITFKNITFANGSYTTGLVAGGAIVNEGNTTLDTVTLTANHAAFGGAIMQESCTNCLAPSLTVTNSAFTGNTATNSGGAINVGGGTLTVTSSTFSGNSSSSVAGAIELYLNGGQSQTVAAISSSTFSGNHADSDGGALDQQGSLGPGGGITVTNCTFNGNTAAGTAGTTAAALSIGAGTTLSSVTIAGNTASNGVGLYATGAPVVRNTIVAGNSGQNCGINGSLGGGSVANLQFGDASCTGFASGDPMLGSLASNGGPTLTMLPGTGSAAINAIPLAGCTETVDQRGLPRPSPSGGSCDIGAVEVQGAVTATKLAFVQQPSNALAGAAIVPAVTVQLQDGGGNAVPQAGVSVAVSLASGTGTLSGMTTQLTDAAGLATFAGLSVNLVGTKTLSAASSGLSGATSTSFVISAGAATSLTITGGNPQTTAVGTPFAAPLQVLLTDAQGDAVSGAAVTFVAPGSGASATLAGNPATTDAAGHAQVTATANATAGAYNVTATYGTLPPVSFALTNAPAPPEAAIPMLGLLGLAVLGLTLAALGAFLLKRGV